MKRIADKLDKVAEKVSDLRTMVDDRGKAVVGVAREVDAVSSSIDDEEIDEETAAERKVIRLHK